MSKPAGLILAGGLASRMGGGDKTLHKIGGKSVLARIIARISTQCSGVIINANGDPARLAFAGLPIIPDTIPDYAGPLAGLLAGLDWVATDQPAATHLLSVPGDCPFLPHDLVERLAQVREQHGTPIACARSGEQRHHTVGLWPVSLRDNLRDALIGEKFRKVQGWAARHGVAFAQWPDVPFDPFLNINTPDDLSRAEAIATAYPSA